MRFITIDKYSSTNIFHHTIGSHYLQFHLKQGLQQPSNLYVVCIKHRNCSIVHDYVKMQHGSDIHSALHRNSQLKPTQTKKGHLLLLQSFLNVQRT